MSDLIALAERVEAAQGADRELDLAIDLVVRADSWLGLTSADNLGHPIGWLTEEELPPYSASLDAAMQLLAGKVVLISLSEIKGDGMPMAIVGNPETSQCFKAVAETMPLALTAAALKALAAIRDGEPGK